MDQIKWGIIGCGDVTEVKSGPAFNKVPDSALVAVMRRDADKAKHYAARHGVPKWYAKAEDILNDPEINAIYIATPPASHAEYAEKALQAGKFVYVEKPMTIDYLSALSLKAVVEQLGGKLSVAHYRRAQPRFLKIKELVDEGAIGKIKLVNLKFFRKNVSAGQLEISKYAWRVDPALAGGGLFHDIAPHQLDMVYYLFGAVESVNGIATNSNALYAAADNICGNILFKNKVLFSGSWCFDIGENALEDFCEIIGERGNIQFSFFDKQDLRVTIDGQSEIHHFEEITHAQQPLIEKIVSYFLDKGPNPCSIEEGLVTMELLEKIAGTSRSK